MGCLSRIGCLVVLAGAGAVGYWLYGDRLPSELGRLAERARDKVTGTAGNSPADSSRRASSNDPFETATWVSVRDASGTARADPVAELSRPNGPAYVTLGPRDLAELLSRGLVQQLPRSSSDLHVALEGRQMLVRAEIEASEIAGDGTLGRMLGIALTGRDTVEFAGSVERLAPRFAQFRVERLRLKGVDVPPRLIPMILRALRRGTPPPGLADNALAIPLPAQVADVRIENGKLTLYKATSAP